MTNANERISSLMGEIALLKRQRAHAEEAELHARSAAIIERDSFSGAIRNLWNEFEEYKANSVSKPELIVMLTQWRDAIIAYGHAHWANDVDTYEISKACWREVVGPKDYDQDKTYHVALTNEALQVIRECYASGMVADLHTYVFDTLDEDLERLGVELPPRPPDPRWDLEYVPFADDNKEDDDGCRY